MKLKKYGRKCVRPYPVLGNGNDFAKESFRTNISMKLSGNNYVIDCEFVCENRQISEMIKRGEASFALDMDCPSIPGSRRGFKSHSTKNEFIVGASEVNNEIALAAFVVADKELKDYAPEGIHPDYHGIKFHVLPHDTIAQDEDQIKMFNLNKGGMDSLIKVRRSDSPGDRLVRFDERDHFWIILPMVDFDNWVSVQRTSGEMDQHVVAPSFVLPAVMEAIERIKRNPDYVDDDGPRWARSLNGRCCELGMDIIKGDTSEMAQTVLNFPIGRVCEHALGINDEDT